MEEQKKTTPFSEEGIKHYVTIYTAERLIKHNQRMNTKRDFNRWINSPDSIKMKQLLEAIKLADIEFRNIKKRWKNT